MKLLTDPRYIYKKNQKNFLKSRFKFTYQSDSLKTKNGNNLKGNIEFQNQLNLALKSSKRRTFQSDVALKLVIRIKQNNAPSIQNIAKNYIDLICRTLPSSQLKRKTLILKDDLQIKYLSVIYQESNEENSSLSFDVIPYTYFLERIHLVKWFNLYNYNANTDSKEQENDLDNDVNCWEEYKSYVSKSIDVQLTETDVYQKLYYQRRVQESFLHNNRIKNESLVDLYYPITPSQNDLTKPLINKNDKLNFESIIFDLNIDTFQLDLGKLPAIEGESQDYKNKIKNQINRYLNDKQFLKPILSTIGITVLVKQGKTLHKDLDNIAREIIKILIQSIQPPTSQWNSLQATEIKIIQVTDTRKKENSFKNPLYPKNGFINYKVVYLPSSQNKEEEFIKVNIHDGNYFYNFDQYIDSRFNRIGSEGEFSRYL